MKKYVLRVMEEPLALFVKTIHGDLIQEAKRLLPTEVQQAKRRLSQAKLRQFIISRAFVRHTLGLMLGTDWQHTPICLSKSGKPYLPALARQLWFNVSHAKNTICVAFSQHSDIGVDIESAQRVVPNALKKFAFSEHEQQMAQSQVDINSAFLHYWVAKEAVLKCIGCGLNRALQSIRIEQGSDGQIWAQDLLSNCVSKRYFQLFRIPDISGYVGYLALPVSTLKLPINQQKNVRNSNYQWRLE
ncbi:4'-phosphopantetheinyl transferase family protein [Pseudoalteromonas sp. S16_S37]|uniref:4'-phosphopantetheinyl transferase family protein n=1 Tax=Pseudoalteromonas sp. S16_S37 TaxID=2720228 RepID=UPI0016818247|nr:4'-phosphopantetheinyl transferase superfamily protein [Pseudoalteromonas sp. S16_S37]MBD1582318.1 4'-phosphopantetheinyl transferase superfamily protein [Pseudoalteromonas sp. S16_S37]